MSILIDPKYWFLTKKRTPKLSITISGKVLEQVEEFIYLGVKFNKTGNFAKTSEYMRIKAQKTLFSLIRSLIYKPIAISTMLKIFDKTIMVHVPNFGGLSGSEDRGERDNSIQFINFGRVGDKSFKEWRQKIGGWKVG